MRAAEAVERFGDRVFEVIRERPEELCVIKGITPDRAQVIHDSFATVAAIANVDSWLRHIGLGKADARRVREAYGDDAARPVRENPYRLADEIHGIGFLTADSLRVMLGIGPTSPFRLHAALESCSARRPAPRGTGTCRWPSWSTAPRASSQRRAGSGRWEPDPELVAALRADVPTFASSDDAHVEARGSGDLEADDARVYGRELYDDECLAADRLAQLLAVDAPLFKSDELDRAIERAELANEIVLEAKQRRAIATALSRQVSIISGGPGVGKTTSVRVLVDLLEQRGVPYMLLSPTGKAAKRLAEATLRDAYTIHPSALQPGARQKEQEQRRSRSRASATCSCQPTPSSSTRRRWSTCRCWPGCCARSARGRG